MRRRRRGRVGWTVLVLAAVFVLIAGGWLIVTGECPKWCVAALGVALVGEMLTELGFPWRRDDVEEKRPAAPTRGITDA